MRCDQKFLDSMRRKADDEADTLIANVFRNDGAKKMYPYLSLNKLQVERHDTLPEVQRFLLTPSLFPDWFEKDRLIKGQKFFRKYALDIMTLLGAMSLPYCYAASPGNKAIYLSEKMRKTPGKRLLETAHFIIEVMKENAFEPDGSGAFEVQKTRLIHALVRSFIQYKTSWDLSWGLPVNQEDMAGTNLAFSYIIIRGMQQSDFTLNEKDVEDFLYTWRFIGYQLRIDEGLLPASTAEAMELEHAIRGRHFRESTEGPLLASELIQHYKESFPAAAAYFVDSQIRYFIGPEVSELLGLRPQPWKDSFVEMINRLRKKINRHFINPYSYNMMLRNHLKLKEKYADVQSG